MPIEWKEYVVYRKSYDDPNMPATIKQLAPFAAAEEYCEKSFDSWGYPKYIEGIVVIDPDTKEQFTYDVDVIAQPTFVANRV